MTLSAMILALIGISLIQFQMKY